MDGWLQDLKSALRSIARSKQHAFIVAATLALGLGANTAVFSVLNAVVLRPLPYDEPERLVRIYASSGGEDSYLPGPVLTDLRETSRTIDLAPLYTYSPEGVDLSNHGQPERVRRLKVGADYLRVLRVTPLLGRQFERSEEIGTSRVAAISHRIWRDYLGGATDAVGRSLALDGVAHTVVAVLPDGFADPLEPGIDVWTPVDLALGGYNSWGNYYLSAIGRLRPGVTIAQTQTELAGRAAGLEWNRPGDTRVQTVHVLPLQEDTIGSAARTLWLLLGAVGLLLLIACVNVANLALARGAAREADLAVRSALGGSRWRLVRQLLVENVVLSMAGGIAGLVLARLGTTALLLAAPEAVARTGGPLETIVIAVGFAAAVVTGVVVGLAPALQLTGGNLEGVLRESSRTGSGSRRLTRTRHALVVCQIALALVLLIAAGLMLRSFDRLRSLSVGVDTANVVTFEVNLPLARYADAGARARFHRDFETRIGSLPGVRAAGAISRLPLTGTYHRWGTSRPETSDRTLSADQRTIEGAYFEALQIPVLRGRTFNSGDDERAPRRAVVSQELVRRLFGGEDPIGRTIRVAGANLEVIGVVGDAAISARGTVRPMVYHSHSQFAGDRNWALTQVVAVDRVSPSLVDLMRRELAGIDPALVMYQARPLADVAGLGVAQERFALSLLVAFALLALALAAIGVYGVLSYAVTRRGREMGIRMALGAPAGAVSMLIVRDGARLAAVGVAVGLAGAYASTRLMQSLLFGVSATEPAVFATAAAALAGVALVASWIPARAATRVDPIHAVRAD